MSADEVTRRRSLPRGRDRATTAAGDVAVDEAAVGWEEQWLPPRIGHGTAAEDVASVVVAARAAVGNVATDEATGGEDEQEPSLWARPRDSRGGRHLRGRGR